LGLCSVCVL